MRTDHFFSVHTPHGPNWRERQVAHASSIIVASTVKEKDQQCQMHLMRDRPGSDYRNYIDDPFYTCTLSEMQSVSSQCFSLWLAPIPI